MVKLSSELLKNEMFSSVLNCIETWSMIESWAVESTLRQSPPPPFLPWRMRRLRMMVLLPVMRRVPSLQADAVAGRGLAGNGDVGLDDAQVRSWNVDVAADGENDRAAGGGGRGDALGERAGAGGGQVGDGVDVAATTAGGVGAETLRAGKGGDLGRGGV